eukprot:gene10539-14161_t
MSKAPSSTALTLLPSDSNQPLQAKGIVLGDPSTGKTALITALQTLNSNFGLHVNNNQEQSQQQAEESSFFKTIEFLQSELYKCSNSSTSVTLKLWEASSSNSPISENEEEVIYSNSLFCIIIFDIRNPISASNVFRKWKKIKDKYMPDSFLFVIGTFVDQAISRKVVLHDICRTCAENDAIYLEVSCQVSLHPKLVAATNQNNNYNISFLRQLLLQRINYILERREFISQQPFFTDANRRLSLRDKSNNSNNNNANDNINSNNNNSYRIGADERKGEEESNNYDDTILNNNIIINEETNESNGDKLNPYLIDNNILCDSVGSIISSCLGIESWPGYDNASANIDEISHKISSLINKIASESLVNSNNNVSSVFDDVDYFINQHEQSYHNTTATLHNNINFDEMINFEDYNSYLEASINDMDDLKKAYDIMNVPFPTEVKLPTGSSVDLSVDLEMNIDSQIDLFMLSNGMTVEHDSRRKLMELVTKMKDDFIKTNKNIRKSIKVRNSIITSQKSLFSQINNDE